MKKRLLVFMSLILIAVMLAACASSTTLNGSSAQSESSAGDYSGGYNEDADSMPAEIPQSEEASEMFDSEYGEGFMEGTGDSSQVADMAGQMGSKIIKSGYMSVETVDFEETTSAISRRVQQAGGFIASSNVHGWSQENAIYKPSRRAHYKIRIPSEKFEQFMTDVGTLGNVTNSENWGDDVSAEYFDTEARLKSLTTQEERLLTILSKAEQLMDIIELERELSNVRYQIENLTGTLRKYDNLVAYSTLEIDVVEVEEITETEEKPVTLWEKIVYRFENSIKNTIKIAENLLLFLIAAVPFLLLLGIIFLIIFILVRFVIRSVQKYQKKRSTSNNKQVQGEEKEE